MADTRIVLQHRLTQQLVMTPQLRQAIKILQVSRAELETLIDQELTENPVLEEHLVEDKPDGEVEVPTVDGQNGVVQALSRRTRLRSCVQALRNGVRGARFVSGFINSSTGDGGGVTGAGFSGVL